MKTALSAILTLLFLGQLLYLPVAVLWLEGKRDIIAREFCVNQDEPELMCQGSCHINRVVARAMENAPYEEMPLAPSQKEPAQLSVFLPGSIHFPAAPSDHLSLRPFYRPKAIFFTSIQGVFRPPRYA